jgi:hypothetical protein
LGAIYSFLISLEHSFTTIDVGVIQSTVQVPQTTRFLLVHVEGNTTETESLELAPLSVGYHYIADFNQSFLVLVGLLVISLVQRPKVCDFEVG